MHTYLFLLLLHFFPLWLIYLFTVKASDLSTLSTLSFYISLLFSFVTHTPEYSYYTYCLSPRHPVLLLLYPILYISHPLSDLMKGCFADNFSCLWSSQCFCSCCCSFMLLLSNKPNEPVYTILNLKIFFSARCLSSLDRIGSFIYPIILKMMKQLLPRKKLKDLQQSKLALSHSETKWLSNWWIFPLGDQWNFRFTLKWKNYHLQSILYTFLHISFLEGISNKHYLFIYKNDTCQAWLNAKLCKCHWEFWKYLITKFTMVSMGFKGLAIF